MAFASSSGSYMFPKYPLYIKLSLFVDFSTVLIMKLSETFLSVHLFFLCPCEVRKLPKPVVEGIKTVAGMLRVSDNFSWFCERLALWTNMVQTLTPR